MSEQEQQAAEAAEAEKNSIERVYQHLAEVVRDRIFSPLLLLDHIAGRPPGVVRPVAE